MSERVCVCTHPESDHYTYVLNWRDQTRCRSCDPHTGKRVAGQHVAMDSDSYEAAMYHAADHDFEAAA